MRSRVLLLLSLAACAGRNVSAGAPRPLESTRLAAPPSQRPPRSIRNTRQGAGSSVVQTAPTVRLVGATFVDGSPVPPPGELQARVLSLSLVLEQARVGFPPRFRQALDIIAEHIERMADLLAGAEEHPAEAAALDRAVAVGTDLAAYALDLLAAESRPGLGLFRHQRLEYALSWCWEGLRAPREDPFWADDRAQHAQQVHLQAWHFHDENLAGEERSAWGRAGVHAALIVSGGSVWQSSRARCRRRSWRHTRGSRVSERCSCAPCPGMEEVADCCWRLATGAFSWASWRVAEPYRSERRYR